MVTPAFQADGQPFGPTHGNSGGPAALKTFDIATVSG